MQHNCLDQHKGNTSNQVLVQEQTKLRESIVRQTSRLSTEAHPGLIFDDMLLSDLLSLDVGDVNGVDDLIFLVDRAFKIDQGEHHPINK